MSLEELILISALKAKPPIEDVLLKNKLISHALTTVYWFLTDYIITPANIDDRNAVWDLCDKYRSISIIGDKGYINKRLTPELKSERDIDLLFLKRANSRDNYPKEVRQLLFKVRRRIETSFLN